jgi:dTDP-4-dehydrorhamnose reductase
MRCLILGATGHIGSHLVTSCEDRGFARLGTWYTWPYLDHASLDIRDTDAVDELLADYQPDVTFLAAGLTSPGYAETHPLECRELMRDAACDAVAMVARHGGRLVYFSSDEVFGECHTARREEDSTEPVGELSRCHLAAERTIRELLPDRHLILRTGWVYGPDLRRRNFVSRMVRKLANGQPVSVANDRHGQPTFGPDLAEVAVELVRLGQSGTFHVVGSDRHTEFSFARLLAHVYGFDVDLVQGVPALELCDDNPRPSRVWLDRFKLRSVLGPKAIRDAAQGLRMMRNTAELARAA